ncbi:hypothetical protein ACFYMW_12190 [Streptomyces sp. NPDC006692]|uniref:hypothetical protein n=1 Tax=Streptomyces sp. NPDC006692 TaxID=3364758 RepID=UPI003678E7DF
MTVHYTQTVVILRAPHVTDRYGNQTTERDWASATRTTVRRVSVQPADTAEDDGDRPAVTTGLRLITRRGVDIDLIPGDRVVAVGRVLDTDGEPARYVVGGRHHHTEARLKEVNG